MPRSLVLGGPQWSVAAERGSTAETLAQEAIKGFVERDEWFLRGGKTGYLPATAAN